MPREKAALDCALALCAGAQPCSPPAPTPPLTRSRPRPAHVRHKVGALSAERRWILSGTPAKGTTDAEGVAALGSLLSFIRADERHGWARKARACLAGKAAGEEDVLKILSAVMTRHLKRKIAIPPPKRTTTLLHCSPSERLAYNTIVGYIRANIVLTEMKGAEEGAGKDVSILHASNIQSARNAIENIRLTCNGGGKQVARLSEEYYDEARWWLERRYRSSQRVVGRACAFMQAARRGEPTSCDSCGVLLQLQLVFPTCGHLVCAECVDEGTTACPACAVPLPSPSYLKCARCDMVSCSHPESEKRPHVAHPLDGFAYLQPGFDLEWAETRQEREALLLAESYAAARRAEAGGGGGDEIVATTAAASGTDGAVGPSGVSGAGAGAVGDGGRRVRWADQAGDAGSGSERAAGPPQTSNTKAQHIISRLVALRAAESAAFASGSSVAGTPRVKAVIYSENKRTLNNLGHFLYLRFGDDAIAQFWGKYRSSELDKFRASRVRFWRCMACPPRLHEASHSKQGREVEWPEARCYGKHVTVELIGPPVAAGAAAVGGGGGEAAAGAARRLVTVNEEDVRSYVSGVRWTLGQMVEVRERPSAPWVWGRITRWAKCGAKMGEASSWSERKADCFVLLLTRDGSHGLDLSKVTHIFMLDQCWDPGVEQQVISRAFRMGATSSVHVEQLLMAGTLEEHLHELVASRQNEPSAACASRDCGGASGPSLVGTLAPADTGSGAGTGGGRLSSGDGGVSCLPCASEEGGLDPARAAQVDGPCANGEKAAGKRPVPAGPLETWPRKRPHSDQRTAGSNDGTRSHAAQSDEAAACEAPAVAKAGGLKQSDSKVHALLRGMRFLRD